MWAQLPTWRTVVALYLTPPAAAVTAAPMPPAEPSNAPLLAQTIQLAIAPVFLLTAIGAFLSVITARLGRVIDRARALEADLPPATDGDGAAARRATIITELASLDRRMVLANRAVGLSVGAALIVCLLIAMLFISAVSPIHPDRLVPALFIAALGFLTAALTAFLLEVTIALRTVRVRADLIRHAPRPPGDFHLDLFPTNRHNPPSE